MAEASLNAPALGLCCLCIASGTCVDNNAGYDSRYTIFRQLVILPFWLMWRIVFHPFVGIPLVEACLGESSCSSLCSAKRILVFMVRPADLSKHVCAASMLQVLILLHNESTADANPHKKGLSDCDRFGIPQSNTQRCPFSYFCTEVMKQYDCVSHAVNRFLEPFTECASVSDEKDRYHAGQNDYLLNSEE